MERNYKWKNYCQLINGMGEESLPITKSIGQLHYMNLPRNIGRKG